MNFRGKNKPEAAGFQIAPMIDVVFLLLFFFMTSQLFSQWEAEIDLKLPSAESAQHRQRAHGEIILNVLESGVITVHGQILTADDVRDLFSRLVQQYEGQPVLIRADENVPYRHVMRVMDLCRQADIWNLSFAVLPAGAGAKEGLAP